MQKDTYIHTSTFGIPDLYKRYIDVASGMVREDMLTSKFDANALEIRFLTRKMAPLQRCYYLMASLEELAKQSKKDCHMVILSGLLADNQETNYVRTDGTLLLVGYSYWMKQYYVQKAIISKVGKRSNRVIERTSLTESGSITQIAKIIRSNDKVFESFSTIEVRLGERGRIRSDAIKARNQLFYDATRQRAEKKPIIIGYRTKKPMLARWIWNGKGLVLRPELTMKNKIA